jgi:hypothetical protein
MCCSTIEPTATAGRGARMMRLSLKISSDSSGAGASMIAFASSVCTVPSLVTTRAWMTGFSWYHGAHGALIEPQLSIADSATMR